MAHLEFKKPYRLLNDQRGIFGLWMSDFVGAIGVFVFTSFIFEETRYGIIALPISFLFLGVLCPIRLRTRRKIIRDWVGYLLTPRVIYDPRK